MTKNIPIKLKAWISTLSRAIAFCLLCGSIVSVAYADSTDLEIAFATVSGKASDSTQKTAGCIIVSSTSNKTQNIYCRYELDKDKGFKRDNDKGIKLDNVILPSSTSKVAFQDNIKNWFKNKNLNPIPTPTDLSYFADVISRLFAPKTHYFVLEDKLDIGTNELFAAAVHKRLIKEKIPDKVVEEAKAVATEVQNNGEVAKKEVENAAEQAKIDINKIVADATTTAKKPATDLELSFIYISISLFYLLFIWFFLASRKTTSQLKSSDVLLETNINDNVSTLTQEIADLKTLHKVLQNTTLPKRLSEMEEKLRSELEEKITQLSPVEEPLVGNESSSGDSYPQHLNKKIRQLEEENRQLEIEKKDAQSVIGQLKGKKRDLEKRQRSEQDAHQQVKDDLNSQLKVEKETHQETAISLADKQKEVEKLNQQNQMLETYLKNSKDEHETERTQRQLVEVTLTETKQEVETLSHAEKTLQEVLFKRFRLFKPEEMDFTHWTTALIGQKGSWLWLQPTLLGELLICELIFNPIKKQGAKRDQDILNLLNLDSIMKHWRKLVAQLFETNDKLWVHLHDIDNRQWLTQLLRADDVLKTYFPEEKSFDLLSQHLSNVNGILRAALIEMGVTKILAPKLLEAVPNYVPAEKDRNQIYTPNSLLRELVKEKVQNKIKEMPQIVVDVQRYGFCTADNPNDAGNVQVFVSNPSEWE
jgi:hypothetical protein